MSSLRVQVLEVHRDERGWVAEPLGAGHLPAQRNVHVVVSRPGAVRGNHYHPEGTEILTVAGPALVRTREAGVVSDTPVPDGACYRFTIPPGVTHAVRNTGEAPAVLIAFNTLESPATVRDVILR